MGEVDPAFIQALEHRPNPKIMEAEGIPVIDLSTQTLLILLRKLEMPAKIGVFSSLLITDCRWRNEKRFLMHRLDFLLSLQKRKTRSGETPRKCWDIMMLSIQRMLETGKRFLIYLKNPTTIPSSHELNDTEVAEWHNHWPEYPPELREACEEYAKEMEKLAFKLMELIALSLGMKPDRFRDFFKEQTSTVRLNHCPPCPAPLLALGVGRHKDPGGLTILAQDDVGGLEVKRKSDEEWSWVKPIPNTYIVDIGDIIQVWTNDAYESLEHRVKLNPDKERFSIPYFLNPAHSTMVQPLDEMVNEQNPANIAHTIGANLLSPESAVISKSLMLRIFKSTTSRYDIRTSR
ncbi:hypothetical protein JCGZ_04893 [Jatropha curcas]|uniref:Fe2OG dioxygenase domain-containing protein n=1 Tax=Jatropha curcas TaxID=180498 RepID=A0A067L1A4_JATCU|nr:hypothetical protein JCGZ_04893 [Jatropha curcas]